MTSLKIKFLLCRAYLIESGNKIAVRMNLCCLPSKRDLFLFENLISVAPRPFRKGSTPMALFRIKPSTRSGFRRASVGTLLLISGAYAGFFIGIPELHRTASLSHTPVTMTCLELLRSGVPEHSKIVTLSDAVVHQPDPLTLAWPGQTASPPIAKLQSVLDHPVVKPWVDRVVRAEVLPQNIPKRPGHQPFKLSLGQRTAEVALAETDRNETLTVHVDHDPTFKILCGAAKSLGLELPVPLVARENLPAYTLHPLSLIGSRRDAMLWVGGGAIAFTLGLIVCAGVTIGWWVCFSPVAALAGLPGIPFRNKRGNRWTWPLGCLAGLVCVVMGYDVAVNQGRLGHPEGFWWWQIAGFFLASMGFTIAARILLSIRSARRDQTALTRLNDFGSDVQSSANEPTVKKQFSLRKTPDSQSKIATPSFARRYLDPKLAVSTETQMNDAIAAQAERLEALRFEPPLIIETCADDTSCLATVQVGCQNLVLAILTQTQVATQCRMVSVLDDGHVIISGGPHDGRIASNHDGDYATLRKFSSIDADKLVAKHLEVAAGIAEAKQSQLVSIESREWRDLIHYSDRCLADAMHEAKMEKWDIPQAQYGRFTYPPSRIESPVLA